MSEILIGVVGVAVLAVGFGLVARLAPRQPRGGCGSCALAGACESRRSGADAEREDPQPCFVGGGEHAPTGAEETSS